MPVLKEQPVVNMHEAKSSLSRLVADLESGREEVVVIARHGMPVAQLVPYAEPAAAKRRIGTAKGKFTCPDDGFFYDDSISELFEEYV